MELTQLQISEIISNYTSSSEGFVTLQSLIMSSLMFHERELFVNENKSETALCFLRIQKCYRTVIVKNFVRPYPLVFL